MGVPSRARREPVKSEFRPSCGVAPDFFPSVVGTPSAQTNFLMLTIRELKMTLGGRVLFEDASFNVNYGDRVALVGPNEIGRASCRERV